MNIKGLDIIREAYTKAISVNIEEGNFHTSKYLINALEQLTGNVDTTPIIPAKKDNFVLIYRKKDASGVSSQEMRDYIISYVRANGMSSASDVAYAFELENKFRFTPKDLFVNNDGKNLPNWKRRFYSAGSKLRSNNTLMPHEDLYHYQYAFTPEYAKILSASM